MSKNYIDTLINVFECAGFAKEECDVKHLGEVPYKCNVPHLASLGNAANVCVGSKVYHI